jgi:hypothetical protein
MIGGMPTVSPYTVIASALAAILAAAVSVYAARTSLRSSKASIARDLLTAKISALTDGLLRIHQVTVTNAITDYSLNAWNPSTNLAGAHLALAMKFHNAATTLNVLENSISHYLSRERKEVALQGKLSVNSCCKSLGEKVYNRETPLDLVDLTSLSKPFEQAISNLSCLIQAELEVAVHQIEKSAGISYGEFTSKTPSTLNEISYPPRRT